VRHNAAPCHFKGDSSWVILSPIERSIKEKIERIGMPLKDWDVKIYRGILTGCNEAFIIDEATKQQLIAEDPKSAEIIRPILRGRDIKRYAYEWAGLYLIATHNGIPDKVIPKIDIEKYPAVKTHLNSYWTQIKNRSDQGDTPYNLRSCAYMEDFSKPKIVWGEISDKTKFALDQYGKFCNEATTFLMTGKSLQWLVCFLNSSISEYLFSTIGTTTGVGTVRWKKYTIEQLLVPKVLPHEEQFFIQLLKQFKFGKITEADINRHVYALCRLSEEEITFIEHYVASI